MGLYRKKPVVIEAELFTPGDAAGIALARWCGGEYFPAIPSNVTPVIFIATMEGRMEARPGDWIIKGVQGEFYPIKNDIFEQTYEAVEPVEGGT
jgi:hypothetical protein